MHKSRTHSLKIAHVTATFPPYQSGTGNVCYYNARELAIRGNEVHVFTAEEHRAAEVEVIDGFTVHRLRSIFRFGNAPVLIGLIWALRGFDVIHLHYPFIGGAEMVWVAGLLYKTPVFISFHNDLIGDGGRKGLFWLYQWISALLSVRGVERICAVSMDHYEHSLLFKQIGGRRKNVVELPNGVDTNLFDPAAQHLDLRSKLGIPIDAQVVLFVGALDRAHHFKGLSYLLQAVRLLPENAYLVIVGDGELRERFVSEAEELRIIQRTRFVGRVPHDETPHYFRNAQLVVLPSFPPESFGLVLVEAMACGIPVVASAIPGVRTVVDDEVNGVLVKPGDAVALANAIQRVLTNQSLQREMGKKGRLKVENRYNWRVIGEKLEDLYLETTHKRQLLHHTASDSQ